MINNVTINNNINNYNKSDIPLNNNKFETIFENVLLNFQNGISLHEQKEYDKSDVKLAESVDKMNHLINHEKLKGNSLSRKRYKDIIIECYNIFERNKKKLSNKELRKNSDDNEEKIDNIV